jgi:hypothetical protein
MDEQFKVSAVIGLTQKEGEEDASIYTSIFYRIVRGLHGIGNNGMQQRYQGLL